MASSLAPISSMLYLSRMPFCVRVHTQSEARSVRERSPRCLPAPPRVHVRKSALINGGTSWLLGLDCGRNQNTNALSESCVTSSEKVRVWCALTLNGNHSMSAFTNRGRVGPRPTRTIDYPATIDRLDTDPRLSRGR
eukprot:1184662-Prorocentrum_minimum.AAC.7